MTSLLDRTRERLGPPPRVIHTRGVRGAPPTWMATSDPLYRTYRDTDHLLEQGEVVWGHLVQANSLLFRPGSQDHPADVIFAEDRTFDRGVDRLERAAHEAFALKNAALTDGAYQRVGKHLTEETQRTWRMPVPVGVARGAELMIASIMIHRALLPLPYLGAMFLPLLVSRARPTVIALPAALWAEDLIQAWRDVAAETTG